MRRFTRLTIVLAASALLAGCTTETPPPAPRPSTPSDPSPEATPVVDPVAERADYGFTYFEEADIGGTWDEMGAQLHYPVAGIPECPYYGELWGTGLVGTYAFMDQADMAAGARFFYTMQGSAPATASFPVNPEGVGIGSTQAELLAAYPAAVVSSMTDLGAGDITTVTVDDPDSDSKYVFGFSGESTTVDLLQWGPFAGNQWSHLCGGF